MYVLAIKISNNSALNVLCNVVGRKQINFNEWVGLLSIIIQSYKKVLYPITLLVIAKFSIPTILESDKRKLKYTP